MLVLGMCRNKDLGLDSDADTALSMRAVLDAGGLSIVNDGVIFTNFSAAVCTRSGAKGSQCKDWPKGSPQCA
jgi:hypothetical protein